MSKPFKIDKQWQLNMNMKSGSPFQNSPSKMTYSVPHSDEIYVVGLSLLLLLLLFAVGDLIRRHMDSITINTQTIDTHLCLSMMASLTTAGLPKLECYSRAVNSWFAENELVLNANKSDVMFTGTSAQLCALRRTVIRQCHCRFTNLMTDDWRVMSGNLLVMSLAFVTHTLSMRGACNYHIIIIIMILFVLKVQQ